ncbi:hypothetical protein HDV00_001435 [Rhizophlyctis rosea]|nr:hypothetical protein HDV00_001435 [Rhizophlyctis rosea]
MPNLQTHFRRVLSVKRSPRVLSAHTAHFHTPIPLRKEVDPRPYSRWVNAEVIDIICRKGIESHRSQLERALSMPPPPIEGVTEHIFVDANIARYYASGRSPLLNAWLNHSQRKCYYTPTVSRQLAPKSKDKLGDRFRFYNTPYVSSRAEDMLEVIAEHAKANPEVLEASSADLTIIGEVSVSVPNEWDSSIDPPPYLITANMNLFESFLKNEYSARVTAYAVEQAGLDHIREIVWIQDIGLMYDEDAKVFKKTLMDGPYSEAGADVDDKARYAAFYRRLEWQGTPGD